MARQQSSLVMKIEDINSNMPYHFIPIQNAKAKSSSAGTRQRAKIQIGDLSEIGATRRTKSGIRRAKTNPDVLVTSDSRDETYGEDNISSSASYSTGETNESGHSDSGLTHPGFGDNATHVGNKNPESPVEVNTRTHNGPRRRKDVRFACAEHVALATTRLSRSGDYKRSRSESPTSRRRKFEGEARNQSQPAEELKSASDVNFGSRDRRSRSRERRRGSASVATAVSYNTARPTTFPLKMTTFTSESNGVTQEYVFPCENVANTFAPVLGSPNTVVESMPKRSSDSDAYRGASRRPGVRFDNPKDGYATNNKLKLRGTKSLTYLKPERVSVSAPTSPTFRKQIKSMSAERGFPPSLSWHYDSLESSPAGSRNDSPDSVRSLPSACEFENHSPSEATCCQPIPIISFTRASISRTAEEDDYHYETYDNVDEDSASCTEPPPEKREPTAASVDKPEHPLHSCRSSMREEKNEYSFEDRSTNRRRSETDFSDISSELQSGSGKLRRPPHRSVTCDSEPIRPTARRAAVVSTLPDSDLTCLSDTIASMQRNQPVGVTAEIKRSRWNIFKSKDKDRSNLKLEEVLHGWKRKEEDLAMKSTLRELTSCKGENRWHRSHGGKYTSLGAPFHSSNSARERKRQDAVWELFTSERTYLIDHLLVLQQVFMEPLQELQCEGYLLAVDVRSVFGNLEEVCKVSLDFCQALLKVVGDKTSNKFGCANSIEAAFESFGSVLCPPYQRYCTSYTNSITYREELKSNEDFAQFLKWCERNPRCQRLKLNDFLVSPMQHLTKYPLLLRHIAEYTSDKSQNASIETTLLAVQESLKALEGKVSWLTQFQFLQDLQSSISWPPVYELDTKTTLPDPLRQALSVQPCRNLIANPKRKLIFDGTLYIIENGRTLEAYTLLFDDMVIFTRARKGKRKSSEIPSSLKRHPVLKDGTLLMVHRQPVALDRFMVYDVEMEQASALGVKNAFLVVQENRFQQMTSVTMLQASTEELKRKWLTQLASTAAQWMEKHVCAQISITSPNVNRKTEENGLNSQELLNVGKHSQLARQKSLERNDSYPLSDTFTAISESKSPSLKLNGSFVGP